MVTEHPTLLGVMTPAFESCADRTDDGRSPTAHAGRAVLPPIWSQRPCPCLPHVAVLFPAVRCKADMNFRGINHDPGPQFNKSSRVKIGGDSCKPSQSFPKASPGLFLTERMAEGTQNCY